MYQHMHEFLNSYADTQGGPTIIENRLHSEVLIQKSCKHLNHRIMHNSFINQHLGLTYVGGGGVYITYMDTYRHKVRVSRDHLSDHRHTSRSKSVISMVAVGTVATAICTCTTYLWVTLSVVLFRWNSSEYLASVSPGSELFQYRCLLASRFFSGSA